MTDPTVDSPKPHEWAIPEREYLRQEAHRGRRHAYETLDPARTALVVIDMVPFFVNDNPYCAAIVPNINAIARSLRDTGGLVVWVLPGPVDPNPERTQEFFGPERAEVYAKSGGTGALPDRAFEALDAR